MSIEKANFDAIDAADVQELIEAQVPEGLRLDYKRASYGKSEADRKELLKDVSAFANSQGGHLVIGVDETGGVATDVVGIDIDPDAEILRIEQILRSAIDPPIPGIRIRAISLASGKAVLLLRIPRSWNLPHRVTFQGINRFYLRHSAGVHEPSLGELRALFGLSETALERAREFRNRRIAAAIAGEGSRALMSEGRLFIHIIPVAGLMGMVNIDAIKLLEARGDFRPLGVDSMTPRFN